jgi:bis(5'-adenosyl)-triphosphatase
MVVKMNNLKNASCPFCREDVQAYHFAASGNFLAIYNLAPILPGHSLIIPQWHIESYMELSDQEICELTLFTRDIIRVLQKTFGHRSFDWTIQEGQEAGQTISHLHLHLIPRAQSDLPQPGDWYPLLERNKTEIIDSRWRSKLSDGEMKSIVSKLKTIALEVLSK